MSNTINNRLKEVVNHLGVSNSEFAKSIGIPSSTISNVFNRDGDVKTSIVTATLLKYNKISPEWLLLGEGDMIKKAIPKAIYGESSDIFERYTEKMRKLIEQRDDEIRSLQIHIAMLESKMSING